MQLYYCRSDTCLLRTNRTAASELISDRQMSLRNHIGSAFDAVQFMVLKLLLLRFNKHSYRLLEA